MAKPLILLHAKVSIPKAFDFETKLMYACTIYIANRVEIRDTLAYPCKQFLFSTTSISSSSFPTYLSGYSFIIVDLFLLWLNLQICLLIASAALRFSRARRHICICVTQEAIVTTILPHMPWSYLRYHPSRRCLQHCDFTDPTYLRLGRLIVNLNV